MRAVEVVDDPVVIWWSGLLSASFRAVTSRDLAGIPANADATDTALQLFSAPVVVLSHDTRADPILNYGNAAALRRWDLDWAAFVSTPSAATTDDDDRADRQAAFARVRREGFVDRYRGTRIDRHGNRFEIVDTTIWEIRTADGTHVGDAATFTTSDS